MAYRKNTTRLKTNFGILLSLLAIMLFFLSSGSLSYRNIQTISEGTILVRHTHEVIIDLENLLSMVKDAETGQRGFVLTGDERYLQPYNDAATQVYLRLNELTNETSETSAVREKIPQIKAHLDAKFAELNAAIELRRTQGFEAAAALIKTDRGKQDMDAIRALVKEMEDIETELRNDRIAEMNELYRSATYSALATCLIGILLSCAIAYLVRRASIDRRRQQWLANGELGLANAIAGEHRIETLGQNILKFFADYLDAHAGAFFTREEGTYKLSALYGVPENNDVPKGFKAGDGLLGQSAQDKNAFIVRDVPGGYLKVGSALGNGAPRNLVIATGMADDIVEAVFELGFIHDFDELSLELLQRASETIGIAVKSANYRASLQNFLEETQRQAEELQAQSEELRVSNEELEEQSRALKESQSRLEQQQAELEQTNAQLEEQAQQLEVQRDDLAEAQNITKQKAQELEQASRYKSDFLANMSHELRTPLNSSLILAKLLADNPNGNLTEEQVRHAQTIQSSGNDLLTLINDILDLSKIEAGHMEINPESISMKRMAEEIGRVFQPIAHQKNISFSVNIHADCPDMITTDRLRLEQVLKNLLSNAFKFTEKGSVELGIACAGNEKISFAVKDSGIGIAPEHQKAIFEAFRQADGTISRKYGGTGLGLSISRQLARLLGGSIGLESTQGEGSVFTLTIPATYSAESVTPLEHISVFTGASVPAKKKQPAVPVARFMPDDREKLTQDKNTLLVIEDDTSFARILYELSHELGFQCLLSATAEDAMILSRQYTPNAVILDIGLPDHSGLSVLDRLKRDPRTRHIPVHVISADDYAQKALSLGAVGYMIKPVKREEIVNALGKIGDRLTQGMRSVLIVEDDKVQRESLCQLLGMQNVETLGVGTAAECLEKLKETTFDCMVLDLSLPDASGYTLLETLSQEEAYSFPPVIVYTGQDLSADEEQRLRRYSKSIIIKGAKSPERLLDEVTLFLHQVVSDLPPERQKMLQAAGNRDAILENRRILVVEDDIRNVYSLTNVLEPRGAIVQIARNGHEAIEALEKSKTAPNAAIDLVLMDVMMPEMDGITATREIRKKAEWKKLPIIMLTAKAMKDDQERCLNSGANDYMAKPLDVDKLLSLVRVWMPR